MPENWAVLATCLPLVVRRCPRCPSTRFRATGRFRVNANHKLLDAWLLVRCTGCGDTAKLTILDRTSVRAIRPALLDRLQDNDSALITELLQDPTLLRRNHIALDWCGAWRLDTDGTDHPDRVVRFAAPVPVRPVRLIAQGCGLARAEVERLCREGKLVSPIRLDRIRSTDFTFTLERHPRR